MLRRRSIRLDGYDYAQEGAYFVTICTYQRDYLFGSIVKGEMICNLWGEIVTEEWGRTEIARSNVELDAFVVMPNHFHGIIVITKELVEPAVNGRGMARYAQDATTPRDVNPTPRHTQDATTPRDVNLTPRHAPDVTTPMDNQSTRDLEGLARQAPTFGRPVSGSLGTIIGAFKSAVTRRINLLREEAALYEEIAWREKMMTPIWQRNYHEHIIRSEKRLNEIRHYIAINPEQWEIDSLFARL